MRRSVVVGVGAAMALGASAVVGACTSASGDVEGGDVLVDAATLDPHCAMTSDAGTGHTFHELYADYFGHASTGCGHDGACHVDVPGKENAATITHFVCPQPTAEVADASLDGSDEAAAPELSSEQICYATMTGASGFVTVNDVSNPTGSMLYKNLRKSDGTGPMPKDPPCTFSDRDLERIAAWIADGAKND